MFRLPDGNLNAFNMNYYIYERNNIFLNNRGTLSSGGGSLSRYLREVDLPITTEADCRALYGTSYDATTMVCAGAKGDGKDTVSITLFKII